MLAALLLAAVAIPQDANAAYAKEVEAFRAEVAADLQREDGWLAVSGLFWLKEGANSVGSAPGSQIELPKNSPQVVGTLTLETGVVTARLIPPAEATLKGQRFEFGVLRPDVDTPDDRVRIGPVILQIVKRSDKIGVRMWDTEAKARREFKGLDWYPVDPKLKIEAKYVPYEKPREMAILNVIGQEYMVPNPGYVEFTVDGQPCRLEAQASGDGLFFNFRDGTSGKTTYPPGRYLGADAPKDGKVILDFNKATNPPCAYTNFATCPLPPKGNDLTAPIPAGEKTFHS